MFHPKYYNRYLDDHYDRQHYGAKLKLKKFDTDEFQSLPPALNVPEVNSENLPYCVLVNDVSFHYNSYNPILNNLNLHVPQGKIYALLGASGCGKTTLLRIILGRLKAMSGEVKVFGVKPGTSESNIPGPGVGYMPQDLALFTTFTISEVLFYFGRLYGMDPQSIRNNIQHFISLLNLPSKNRLVSKLSGGQQRRVSLAVTLIHGPPLLILDEPTVGVDSVLRLRIWSYLEELCHSKGTTVIITTHYTEEAKNAFRVGFIDSGTVLAEDNPQRLLRKYNCKSLEDVFLELCLEKSREPLNVQGVKVIVEDEDQGITILIGNNKNDEDNKENRDNNNNNAPVPYCTKNVKRKKRKGSRKMVTPSVFTNNELTLSPKYTDPSHFHVNKGREMLMPVQTNINLSCSLNRLFALLNKNYILFKRNPVAIIMLNILPLIQISLYCFSLAKNPRNIPVAVVNHDNKSTSLSNIYLQEINRNLINLVPYDNIDDAVNSIHRVKSWLAIEFPANFSRNFRRRLMKPTKLSTKSIEGSKIFLYPDNSHSVFALYTTEVLLSSFESFAKKVSDMLGLNPTSFGSPIEIQKPVYGKFQINYSETITAGMIICVVHGMSMLIGSFAIVRERNEGHLERGFVAGIKPAEILISHMMFYFVPVISQVVFTLMLLFLAHDTTLVGSIIDVFFLSSIQALQGMVIGVTASILCLTDVASLLTVFIIEMPLIFTSGTLWPIESLPVSVQNVLMWNPLTLPITALRCIMMKGWTLTNFQVMLGFISSISYMFVSLVFSFIIFQIQNTI